MIKLYKLYVQPVLQYGVLIYGCQANRSLNILTGQKITIRIIFGLKKFNSVRDVREKYKLLTPMEFHLYELLKLMSKSLRQSSDCGYGSQIFSNEEVRNIQSDERRLKTVKTMRLTTCQQKKPLRYRTRKLLNFLVTLDKNIVREILVVSESALVNILHKLRHNYIQGNEVLTKQFW